MQHPSGAGPGRAHDRRTLPDPAKQRKALLRRPYSASFGTGGTQLSSRAFFETTRGQYMGEEFNGVLQGLFSPAPNAYKMPGMGAEARHKADSRKRRAYAANVQAVGHDAPDKIPAFLGHRHSERTQVVGSSLGRQPLSTQRSYTSVGFAQSRRHVTFYNPVDTEAIGNRKDKDAAREYSFNNIRDYCR